MVHPGVGTSGAGGKAGDHPQCIPRQELHAMKISYYPETDSMYIDLAAKDSAESREVSPGVVIDYAMNGDIVGIDIDNASSKLDLRELTLNRIPVDKQTIAA
jgi:uncharacterized protein YuzE